MAYINVVMSLMDFVPYVNAIIEKNNGHLYVEKRNGRDSFYNIKVDIHDFTQMVEVNREKNLNFFISSKELDALNINFYDDSICQCIIEGVGGRETDESIERIALRIISKTPEKEIVKIFNAIKHKLKNDKTIGVGVEGGGSLHKNYFYQKKYVGKKVFKTDINNDISPIIIIT